MVRIPPGYCEAFGHKPTFGIVSQGSDLDRVGGGQTDPDINVFGPPARSAADLDLLLGILAGPKHRGRRRLAPGAWSHSELGDYRAGLWLDDPDAQVDGEVLKMLAALPCPVMPMAAFAHDQHGNPEDRHVL
jgi:amidase